MKWIISLLIIIAVSVSQLAIGQTTDKKSDKLITISGKVLNADKEPVGGVVFYIDNIRTNNTTKSNGSYKIKVSPSAIDLEVRSPEYGSLTIPINGQTSIDFILDKTFTGLKSGDNLKDTRERDSIKMSAKPKGRKMNTYNDIYQMIRGEVSGVIVSGHSIQIQQGHSFIGSKTPLFVINGVIVPSIDNVNPLEVKSITVLKGSAAAIYGVNGTNGVLSITLKNGTEMQQNF